MNGLTTRWKRWSGGRNAYRFGWSTFAAIFVLVGLVLAFQLHVERDRIRNAETKRLTDLSRYVTANLAQQLVGVNDALTGLGASYLASKLTASPDDTTRQLMLLSRAMSSVRAITVFDGNGVAVASSDPSVVGVDFFAEESFALARARPAAGALFVSHAAAQPGAIGGMRLSRSMVDAQGQFVGAIVATIDISSFKLIVQSALFAPDIRVTLTHVDGNVILTLPAPTQTLSGPLNVATAGSAFVDHVRSGRASTIFEGRIAMTGQDRLVVLNSVSPPALAMDNPVVFSVSRGRDAVYAPWYTQLQNHLLLYLSTLGLTVAAALLAQRRQRHLRDLRRASREQLAASAARLERALEGADLGLWELALDTQTMQVDARGMAMIGMPQAVDQTVDAWNGLLHPADRESNTRQFVRYLKGETTSYESQFRIRPNAGAPWIWLFSRGKITARDAAGRPLRIVGTFMDVTAAKLNEHALAQAALILRNSGQMAKVGGWALDLETKLTTWTPEVYRIHDLDPAETPDLSGALSYYTPESRPLITAAVERALSDGTPWDLELEIVSARGRRVWVRALGEPLREEGRIVQLAGAFQDITERKHAELELQRLNASLSELSYTDALTGLGNRRLFDDALASEWARALRGATPIACLMIDVDHFKRYNDHHGHPAGDACLRQVAGVLQGTLRTPHEKALRYGGEEFVVLLPGASANGAMQAAQRVLRAIAAADIVHGASPVAPHVTVSIGVASLVPTPALASDELVRQADAALYLAKTQGRARAATLN